jgi:hypothetical protein
VAADAPLHAPCPRPRRHGRHLGHARAAALWPALHLGCLRAFARWQARAAHGPAPGMSLALLGARQMRLLVGL